MRILVNYESKDQAYLPILQYHLKNRNFQAIATTLPLSIGELVMKAKNAKCDAILICNGDTLKNCVSSPKATLDLYRGSVLRFSVPALVCNSLSHTQTVSYGSWLLGRDLDKFKKISTGLKDDDLFFYEVLENVFDFHKCLDVLRSAVCIAYDIETKTVGENEETFQGGETFITCVSYTAILPSGKLKSYVLPMVDFLHDHWKTDTEYANAIEFLRMANALEIPKVMHNGLYDCLHSIAYRAYPMNWTLDTMAMAHAEFSELPKSLDFVASITVQDYMQWKTDSEEASKNKDIQQYWGYNAKDTWYTARILLHYLKHLPAYAKKNYASQFPLVYPALYCSFEGLLIDQEVRSKLKTKAQEILDAELSRLRVMFADPDFKPSSPKQVQHYIYDVFGAADPKIGQRKDAKTGRRTRMERGTDEKNLRAVGDQHPILLRLTNSILSYRENAKAISTYFNFLQLNGRLLWSLNPFGTDTGRMSCSSSSFWCGTQVQNIPSYAKDMLIADPDYTLIEIDNSQSEARCTAYLSKEYKLAEALETVGKDFYTSLGTLFFGIPYEEVSKELRNNVLKKIVHGSNYAMGAATFIENVGTEKLIRGAELLGIKLTLNKKAASDEMTLKEFAAHLLDSYHKPFPRIREWYKELAADISATHMLHSPLGYTRYFFGDINKNHNMLRGAIAHSPQNLSVAVLNIGLLKLWKLIKQECGAIRLKAQIHDSVFMQIRDDRVEELLPKVLKLMDNPVEIHGRILRIPVDYKIGKSWKNMTEVKSIRG